MCHLFKWEIYSCVTMEIHIDGTSVDLFSGEFHLQTAEAK